MVDTTPKAGGSQQNVQDLSETETYVCSGKTLEKSITYIKEENTCVFCLESTNLIHFCECAVLAHKKCAVRYVTYPTNVNESCPMCRRYLTYEAVYGDVTMKTKFIFYIFLIILSNITVVSISLYVTTLVIPQNEMNILLYTLLICNLSIIIPVTLVFLISMVLGCCGPKSSGALSSGDSSSGVSSSGGSSSGVSSSGGLSSGGSSSGVSSSDGSSRSGSSSCCSGCYCGGCPNCDCDNGEVCGGGDDGCEIVLLGLCLIIILLFWISGIVYMCYSIWKYHKSFKLKSAIKIQFKLERRVNDGNTRSSEMEEGKISHEVLSVKDELQFVTLSKNSKDELQ